jgi:hypothetical protein
MMDYPEIPIWGKIWYLKYFLSNGKDYTLTNFGTMLVIFLISFYGV